MRSPRKADATRVKSTPQRSTRSDSAATRTRILLAAERLFAGDGLHAVSVRQIAAAAKVPVALVSYHFGSKDALYAAIFESRYSAITTHREASLAEIDLDRDPQALERVVEAFVAPVLVLARARGGKHFAQLVAREAGDPREAKRGILARHFDPTARDYIHALRRVLPRHSNADVCWGYQFMLGAMVMTILDQHRVNRLSGGDCRADDVAGALARMVPFLADGLRACATAPARVARVTPRRRSITLETHA
jgi:AcrR family transcriptional regulator